METLDEGVYKVIRALSFRFIFTRQEMKGNKIKVNALCKAELLLYCKINE